MSWPDILLPMTKILRSREFATTIYLVNRPGIPAAHQERLQFIKRSP